MAPNTSNSIANADCNARWTRFGDVANGFISKRSRTFSAMIGEHLNEGMRVLDLGCGDLGIARHIQARFDKIDLVAVDLLTPKSGPAISPGIERVFYDGRRLPFADRCFDASYLAFVLHHSSNHFGLLQEVFRVTRHSLIILEDVYQNPMEQWLLRICDLGNLLLAPGMDIPFTYRREEEWLALLTSLGARQVVSIPIRPVIPKPTRHRKLVVTL